ncbi:helix-turn-helix domain-containing protein [Aureliella helgolandensis]|uniref:Helix-turn-helix domain protein n=1 Tax=Aureliella helgolandensis TaxID=2527968 RepID=A0A518G2V4_9BACT|nr:helix-turn-helix domain-containing protein [Aureliella helgolandensis]QDV22869.1 Helix-turn-helix domain protein [Aureliella helgolandensis]
MSGERWPALLSLQDAAEYLGVSTQTVGRLKARGAIRSVVVNGTTLIRYRRSDLDLYIERLPEGDGACPNPALA